MAKRRSASPIKTSTAPTIYPDWSPDGKQIAFSFYSFKKNRPEIYKMHADGSHVVNLTGNAPADDFPAWSPDGTRIAFTDDIGQLYTITPQGTGLTKLTQSASANWYAAWSPDGTRLAYSRSEGTDPFEIWTMDADGSSQTKRSSFFKVDERRPTWSPDGTLIAFEADLNLLGIENEEIDLVTADGTKTDITNNLALDGDPAWGP